MALIVQADALVYPRAVMVVFEDAASAYTTVVRSLWLLLPALSAFGYSCSCDDDFIRPPHTCELSFPRRLF